MPEIPLLGGGAVFLRPLTPADGPALAEGYAELSARSLYLRHHAPRSSRLTQAEITYLTDVDQRDRAAWVLEEGPKGIAVGRYIRLGATSNVAEVALTVLDAWQGRGLSKLLLAVLMRTARCAGIGRLAGAVLSEHTAMWHLVRGLGAVPLASEGDACWAELDTNPANLPCTPATEALRYYDRLLTGCVRHDLRAGGDR